MARDGKKQKGGTPNYFIIGLVAIVTFVGVYVLVNLDWPSHDRKDLVGTWLFDTSDYRVENDGGYQTISSTYWTFSEDGAFKLVNAATGAESVGTYEIDGELLIISFDASSESYPFVVRGDKLTLDEGENALVLERGK